MRLQSSVKFPKSEKIETVDNESITMSLKQVKSFIRVINKKKKKSKGSRKLYFFFLFLIGNLIKA